MRLTSYTDFGLRALLYLATLPAGELSSVAKVSALYNVSRNHMVKAVNQLVKMELIHAQRGKYGGIRLKRVASEINIGAVIRALESNLNGIDCHNPACCLVPACQLQAALAQAMAAFLRVMDGYSLADISSNQTALAPLFAAAQTRAIACVLTD
ncbi:MAG: Rrf2 family transcriptional regulator [Aeromonas sp.]